LYIPAKGNSSANSRFRGRETKLQYLRSQAAKLGMALVPNQGALSAAL
jgi:hypothetical protein